MPRNTVPMGPTNVMNQRLPTSPADWQYKGNKGGETYVRYHAWSRVGTAVTAAAWRICEELQDASGNTMSIKWGQTGSNAIALFDQVFDVSSALTPSAISKASPGEVTTSTPHGLIDDDKIEMVGVGGMVELNSDTTVDATGDGAIVFTVTRVDATKFTIGVDTSGYTTFTSGGSIYPKTIFGLTYS